MDVKEIAKFIKDTHQVNLDSISEACSDGKWHMLIPDSIIENDINKYLICAACIIKTKVDLELKQKALQQTPALQAQKSLFSRRKR